MEQLGGLTEDRDDASSECTDDGRVIPVLAQLFVPPDSDTDDWPTMPLVGSPPPRVAPLCLDGDANKGKPLRLCVASPPGETPCHG